MIKILFGVLLVLGALAILMGAGDTLGLGLPDIFPLIGFGGTGIITALGGLLIASGIYGRKLRRPHENRHRLRSRGAAATATLLVLLFGLAAPLAGEVLNQVSLAGFPLGFYMAAHGSLVLMCVVVFAWALKQDAIDAEPPDGNAPATEPLTANEALHS